MPACVMPMITPCSLWFRSVAALLVALLGLGAGHAASASDPLSPFALRYEVLRNGSRLGEASMQLQRIDSERWALQTLTRGTQGLAALAGLKVNENSEFVWHERRPELRSYRYRQDMTLRSRQRSLLRGADGRIESVDGKNRHDLSFEPGTIDRHTVILAIAADLAAGHRGELRYRVADRDQAEWQRYRVIGSERITARGGTLEALRVERIRERPGRTTHSWFAPALDFALVRSVQTEANGETFELRLLAE